MHMYMDLFDVNLNLNYSNKSRAYNGKYKYIIWVPTVFEKHMYRCWNEFLPQNFAISLSDRSFDVTSN